MSPKGDVVHFLDSLQPSECAETERYAIKEAARRLLARFETPFEQGWTLTFQTPALISALEVCRDLGIWSQWHALDKEDAGAPKSLDQIMQMCGEKADENLLRRCKAMKRNIMRPRTDATTGRLLRHLAALCVLQEHGVDVWKPTPFSLALGDEESHMDHILQCGTDLIIPANLHVPHSMKKYSYTEPLGQADNFADLHGLDFFTLCQRDASKGESFTGLMTALRNHKMAWTEVYDTNKLFPRDDTHGPDAHASPTDGALFVDVGGCHGLDAARLLSQHPDLPAGSIVVQDLPEILEATEAAHLDGRIRTMAHDFFTPQPLTGCRAYFFHAVLHDWPDAECARILRHIVAVMKKGYSRLLVYETVLPAQGASSLMTTLDLQLMNVVSGLERTEGHWRKLLESVGLRIVGISTHFRALESVIEAELA